MKNNFLKYSFLGLALMMLFASCVKDPYNGKETLYSGKTYVWITEAPLNNQFFDVFTNVKPITVFTVRRDAASPADLQKAVTVSLTALPSTYIDAYNTANGTSYTLMPTSIYTVTTTGGISVTSTGLALNYAAGDFAKNVVFNVDGSKVDLSKQYAVAYVITNHGGFSKKVGYDTVFATVAIKNRWDGVYAATGTMTDVTNAAYSHINTFLATQSAAPMQYELRTTSATQCVLFDNYVVGGVATPFSTATSWSYYGSFGLVVNFDPVTNAITSVTNYYGQPAGNGRSARLDVTAPNVYDPASKTIDIGYQLVGGSLVPVGAVRATWRETWKYIGSR
ncbi:MAG: hypothetical protein JWR02_1119 [Mucilaginibacter sp.]|nr:hypothetical protein [Mucilaginibacter sp.]